MNDVLHERLVTPSILSADFGRLGDETSTVIDAGARLIHVDVMDGHFVPNITIGPPVVKALAPSVHERGAALDVHLMIEHPERYVEAFAAAGADALTVHQEACVHLHRTLAQIREAGAPGGRRAQSGDAARDASPRRATTSTSCSSCRSTPASAASVHRRRRSPSCGGRAPSCRQAWPSRSTAASRRQRGRCSSRAGANLLVAGNSVYGAADPAARVSRAGRGGGDGVERRSAGDRRGPSPAHASRARRLLAVTPADAVY